MGLNHEGKIELLRLARRTLEAALSGKELPRIGPVAAFLSEPCGAFVTLERDGELRGCVGRITADKPLYLAVQDMAVQSATADTRFPAVVFDELEDLRIEISVLSPFQALACDDIKAIEIGQHGIFVTSGFCRGLLLPQVALREGWDREQFLSMTCRKAGLPHDAWKNGDCRIEVFTAEVFSEKDFLIR